MGKPIKAQDVNLVFVAGREIFCDSRMIAEKFEVEHKKVMRTIDRLQAKTGKIEGAKLSPSMKEFDPVFIRHRTNQGATAFSLNSAK